MSAQSQARECALTGPRVRTRDPESAHSFSDPSTGICVRVSSSPKKDAGKPLIFGLSALLLMHRPMAGDVDEKRVFRASYYDAMLMLVCDTSRRRLMSA